VFALSYDAITSGYESIKFVKSCRVVAFNPLNAILQVCHAISIFNKSHVARFLETSRVSTCAHESVLGTELVAVIVAQVANILAIKGVHAFAAVIVYIQLLASTLELTSGRESIFVLSAEKVVNESVAKS